VLVLFRLLPTYGCLDGRKTLLLLEMFRTCNRFLVCLEDVLDLFVKTFTLGLKQLGAALWALFYLLFNHESQSE
jgi:hypothetical protein